MSLTSQTFRLIAIALLTACVELLIFYWFGLATTSLEMLSRELIFTSVLVLPLLVVRLAIYVKISKILSSGLGKMHSKSWALFLLPAVTWFVYRVIEAWMRGISQVSNTLYFVAYLMLEIMLCKVFISMILATLRARSKLGIQDNGGTDSAI